MSETGVSWANDLSTVNLSLFEPMNLEGNRVELLRNISLKVRNLEFESKISSEGGALRYIYPQVVMDVSNLSARNCKSTSSGGSFHFESANIIEFKNCSFWNSSSVTSGGSVFISSTNLVLVNESIFNLTQAQNGGSIYIIGRINVAKTWFEKSEAQDSGGSIYIKGQPYDPAYLINDCYFGECNSRKSGGAIYISSSANVKTEISDCTFYQCSSNEGNGGAICLATQGNSIFCDFKRICISKCFINQTNYYGNSIYVLSNDQDILLSFDMITCSDCGKKGCSQGTLYFSKGQQYISRFNISKCFSEKSSGIFLNPSVSSTFMYLNIINCTSSNNEVVNLYSVPSNDMLYVNALYNTASYCFLWVYIVDHYRFTIKFSVFYGNTNILLFAQTYSQTVKNCFIVHNGQISSGFIVASCITTSSTSELTPTYVITHYSTYLCQTPHDLGSLDAPCQTFPEEYKECPTYFPEPTACDVITANAEHSFIILSSLIRIMMVSLINIY